MMDLSGKSVLVTGGAHRVGRAIALAMAERGCNIIVHYHTSEDAAEKTAREARSFGVQTLMLQADFRRYAEVIGMFQALDDAGWKIDLLVNSAAIMQSIDLLTATEKDWHSTVDLNLKAYFFCIQQAAKRMLERGGGAIVNISDVIGLRPWKRFPIHSISKAGVEMLTQVAALALAPKIRVNAVAPGMVLKPSRMPQERWDELTGALPLSRGGSGSDVAEAVVFLFENEFITGETLVVDGGSHLE